jgi:predicted MFS family arabinose efflux permease
MNATMRSVNRGAIVIGAPLGGLLADHLGYRPALWIGAGSMVVQALVQACPAVGSRHQRHNVSTSPSSAAMTSPAKTFWASVTETERSLPGQKWVSSRVCAPAAPVAASVAVIT